MRDDGSGRRLSRTHNFTTNNQNVITGWAGAGGDRGWTYGAGALGLAAAPNDPSKVAYTDLGFVHLSTNGGTTWQQAYVNQADQNPANALTPKNKAYHGIGLENTSCWWVTWADASNIFAGYSDIKGTRSTDGGGSWSFNYTGHTSNLTSASPTFTQLTSYPFRQPERVFFNPYNSNEVWVGSFGHGLRVGSTCSYSAAPLENFSPVSGSAASVSISAPASCPWTAVSNDAWIQITSPSSGTGNASVSYVVSANWTSAARRGTITVAGQTHTIVQDGGVGGDCSYILSPVSKSFAPSGGTGSINVYSQERCAWQATTTDAWLHITSLSCGIGSGTLSYSVDPRAGGLPRTGKIKVAGQVFTVKQK